MGAGNSVARACAPMTGLDPDEFERLKRDVERRNSQISTLEAQLAEVKEAQATTNGLEQTLKEKREQAERDQQRYRQQIERLESELAAKRKLEQETLQKNETIAALESDLDSKRRSLVQTQQEQQDQISQLEQALADKKRLEEEHRRLQELHRSRSKELLQDKEQETIRASNLEQELIKVRQHAEAKTREAREKSHSLALSEKAQQELIFQLRVEQETRAKIEAEMQRLREELEKKQQGASSPAAHQDSGIKLAGKPQFGQPLDSYDTVNVPGYDSPIPAVLVMLKTYLVDNNGLSKKGVFRIPPSQKLLKQTKKEVNQGTFQSVEDTHVVAALLTQWLRELPKALCDKLSYKKLKNVKKDKDVKKQIGKLPEPNRSIFLWFLDLCVTTTRDQNNQMGVEAMAAVFAPNVYRGPEIHLGMSSKQHDEMVTQAKSWATFMKLAITYRANQTN